MTPTRCKSSCSSSTPVRRAHCLYIPIYRSVFGFAETFLCRLVRAHLRRVPRPLPNGGYGLGCRCLRAAPHPRYANCIGIDLLPPRRSLTLTSPVYSSQHRRHRNEVTRHLLTTPGHKMLHQVNTRVVTSGCHASFMRRMMGSIQAISRRSDFQDFLKLR